MVNELIEDAFQKALAEGASDSANGVAKHINEALDGKVDGQPLGVDSIRSYYTKWKNGEEVALTRNSRNDLAVFLGDKDYKAFVERKSTKKTNTKRYLYAMAIMVFVIGFLLVDRYRAKCMKWEDIHYVRCQCSEENAVEADPFKLKKFKKLEAVCEIDFFFDKEGNPKVFYYKHGEKDLELFNSLSFHPENGKALRPITHHMIREHLCSSL